MCSGLNQKQRRQVRINVKIYSMTDCGEAISLTFLSNDWLIGKNCVLLTLCNNKNFKKMKFYILSEGIT